MRFHRVIYVCRILGFLVLKGGNRQHHKRHTPADRGGCLSRYSQQPDCRFPEGQASSVRANIKAGNSHIVRLFISLYVEFYISNPFVTFIIT